MALVKPLHSFEVSVRLNGQPHRIYALRAPTAKLAACSAFAQVEGAVSIDKSQVTGGVHWNAPQGVLATYAYTYSDRHYAADIRRA